MYKKRISKLSTTQIILLGFLATILAGSVLLALPISTQSGKPVAYVDALFTATSATCVTGLVTLTTVSTWSAFGQVVILLLIQMGGLGIITVTSGLALMLHRKISIKDSHLIQDALNLNSLSDLKRFLKKVLAGTLIIEGIGALLYMPVFIPQFGVKGIWISFFNSVSAFCNAGIDIVAENSLCDYALNPLINFTTCGLIILGGLGYIVWWDVLRVIKTFQTQKWKCFKHLTLHSKIVLSATLGFIVGGALLLLVFEYNNPATIGALGFWNKLQICFFQSITTRTAGFATIAQENLTSASAIVCMLLMFIGGSPVGTAGGVKTVTIIALLATAFSTILNKNETTLFQRKLSQTVIKKAVAVVSMAFMIVFTSTLLLAAVTNAPVLDIMYECISATATVGLSRNLTPFLNEFGKWVIIFTMYAGRIGPLTLVVAFASKKEKENNIKNPTEDISVG